MARVIVYHGEYGCETGCCGHYVQLDGIDNDTGKTFTRRKFNFTHPYFDDEGTAWMEWAKRLVREEFGGAHVADLDWENCVIIHD